MSETVLHGWYSQKAFSDFGVKYVYKTKYGIVECTKVITNNCKYIPPKPYNSYKYNDDVRYMGILESFVETINYPNRLD